VTDAPFRLLALPGSLRQGSYNRALARTLPDLAPDGVGVEVMELHDIPLYNADLDTDESRPGPVRELKSRIEAVQGVVVVSPEYNYGVSGVMKNALDWASRPAFRSPMAGKPTGMMGVSGGGSGTMRGQEQLKLTLLGMAARVFAHPGVAVRKGGEKFEDGVLSDEKTRDFVADYLADLVEWIRGMERG
jgi:chromate reductase